MWRPNCSRTCAPQPASERAARLSDVYTKGPSRFSAFLSAFGSSGVLVLGCGAGQECKHARRNSGPDEVESPL